MNITVKQDGMTILVVLDGEMRFDSWEEALKYVGELTKLKTNK